MIFYDYYANVPNEAIDEFIKTQPMGSRSRTKTQRFLKQHLVAQNHCVGPEIVHQWALGINRMRLLLGSEQVLLLHPFRSPFRPSLNWVPGIP